MCEPTSLWRRGIKTSVHSERVKTAILTLSHAELADLSARADRAQHDFAAGGLTTLALTLIILAIVLIILLAVYH